MTNYEYADEQMLERLEATDPSTDDGRWGGDYCMHGTYVGTPGGADYMCGYCEEGLTRWVEHPAYNLGAILPGGQWFEVGLEYDDPENVPLRTLARMRRAIRTLTPIVDGFQVKKVREGYWLYPEEEST